MSVGGQKWEINVVGPLDIIRIWKQTRRSSTLTFLNGNWWLVSTKSDIKYCFIPFINNPILSTTTRLYPVLRGEYEEKWL